VRTDLTDGAGHDEDGAAASNAIVHLPSEEFVMSQPDQFPHPVRFPLGDYLPQQNTTRTVTEPARDVPVLTECDVAVFGGGPAGVCAAAAAARAGKHVVLVERHGFLGGMATAANVNIWHSLYGTDHATKIIGGLPDEIIRRLQHLGAVENRAKDGETGEWTVDSETTKLVMDDVVIGSGVKLLLHTWLAGVVMDERRVAAALVENKSGRQAIVARTYIDCTGDADLVRRAGAAIQIGNGSAGTSGGGGCQPPTLCFRVHSDGDPVKPLHEVQAELGKLEMDYKREKYTCFLWGTAGVFDKHEYMLAGTRVLGVNVADGLDFTRAEIEARYQMRWVLDRMRSMTGWEQVRLLDIAAQIGARESYRILADHQLQRIELLEGRPFEDSIAQGTYRIDIHHMDGPGITFEYLDGRREIIAGDRQRTVERWDGQPADAAPRQTLCYHVPYRSLIPRDLDNVLAAGRCIGADHAAAAGLRVMINAMGFGQAAGTAAAMMDGGAGVRGVDVKALRACLVRDGVPLR